MVCRSVPIMSITVILTKVDHERSFRALVRWRLQGQSKQVVLMSTEMSAWDVTDKDSILGTQFQRLPVSWSLLI